MNIRRRDNIVFRLNRSALTSFSVTLNNKNLLIF